MDFTIKTVVSIEELMEAIAIRKSVFVEEQGISPELDFDNKEMLSQHVLVYLGKRPVATGRLYMDKEKEGHLSRIAVVKNFRSKGLGKLIVEKLERIAKSKNIKRVYLHPHLHLKKFYEDLGYFEEPGGGFNVASHQLIKMSKAL